MDFGVLAMGAVPLKGGFLGGGDCNVPIVIGGITFTPGDYVYCDLDGILLSDSSLSPDR